MISKLLGLYIVYLRSTLNLDCYWIWCSIFEYKSKVSRCWNKCCFIRALRLIFQSVRAGGGEWKSNKSISLLVFGGGGRGVMLNTNYRPSLYSGITVWHRASTRKNVCACSSSARTASTNDVSNHLKSGSNSGLNEKSIGFKFCSIFFSKNFYKHFTIFRNDWRSQTKIIILSTYVYI